MPTTTNDVLEASSRGGHVPDGGVEVICLAAPTELPVLRAVATSIALRSDADLDVVSDLRLAVDEVCSALIHAALPGAPLHCHFSSEPGLVRLDARVRSATSTLPEDPLRALVLTSLADEVATVGHPQGSYYELRTSLRVRVGGHATTAGTWS